MAVWKVLFIFVFGCLCLALATATLIVPLGYHGSERYLWLAGLFFSTLATGGLFALFLRYASKSLDAFPRGSRL